MRKFLGFIIALIIGLVITIGLNLIKTNSIIGLMEYEDIYEERTRLISRINNLEKQNEKLSKEIDEFVELKDKEDDLANIIKEELEINKMLSGQESTSGEGIIIRLEDGVTNFKRGEVDSFIRKQRTIHDNDMVNILNDIKIAGGQAISINDRRLTYNSSVYCAGQFLVIDGFKTPSPFYIKVIGDSNMLYTSLMSDNNSIKNLINREIKIDINTKKNIKINPYYGDLSYDSMDS